MMIRFRFAILGAFFLVLTSCTIPVGSSFETETVDLEDFSGIEVNGICQVILSPGTKNALTMTAEPGIMKNISYSITDDVLHLDLSNTISVSSLDPRLSIQFLVSTTQLKSIHNIGNCTISGSDFSGDTLQVVQDSAGDIRLINISYDTVELDLSGGGKVEINGSIEEQTIHMDGSVSYSSADVQSKTVNATLSGNSKAVVWVTDMLNVETSENASFQLYGYPANYYLGTHPENVVLLGLK